MMNYELLSNDCLYFSFLGSAFTVCSLTKIMYNLSQQLCESPNANNIRRLDEPKHISVRDRREKNIWII